MASDPKDGGSVLERKRVKTEKPRQYQVLFHNDDYTTMELVVEILVSIFNKTETEANHIMLTVHHKGVGLAGVYTKDVAETKVMESTELAQSCGAPLKVTMEPA
jgi:ATP-dependent Clp protease adaptor protein ClpS